MEKKVIFIKLSTKANEIIERFESSYECYINEVYETYYYNFPMDKDTSYLGELSDGKKYYFFALVYEKDEKNKDNFIKAFLGTGTFIASRKSIKITTKYSSEENNSFYLLVISIIFEKITKGSFQ